MVDDEVKRLIDEAYARATDDPDGEPRAARPDRRRAARARDDRPRGPRPAGEEPAAAAAQPAAGRFAGAAGQRLRRSPARRRLAHLFWARRRPNPPARECHAAGAPLAARRCGTRSARTGGTTARRRAAAGGIHPLAFHLTGLDQDALEALVRLGGHARPRGAHRRRLGHARRQPVAAERLRAAVARAPSRWPQVAVAGRPRHAGRAAGRLGDGPRPGRARRPVLDGHPQRHARQLQRRRPLRRRRRGAGAGRRAARGRRRASSTWAASPPGPAATEPVPGDGGAARGCCPVVEALVRGASRRC